LIVEAPESIDGHGNDKKAIVLFKRGLKDCLQKEYRGKINEKVIFLVLFFMNLNKYKYLHNTDHFTKRPT